jgi:YidC/Oxa1 family membrane protein insertase
MNNQKLFLGIAIFLTVFILWDKWQITRTTDANGNIVSKTEITLGASTSNSDVHVSHLVLVCQLSPPAHPPSAHHYLMLTHLK